MAALGQHLFFLTVICGFSARLATRAYPAATLGISDNEISLAFDRARFLQPADFTFPLSEITAFTQRELGGVEYFIVETQRPRRKFRISAATHTLEDLFTFTEAMAEISKSIRRD